MSAFVLVGMWFAGMVGAFAHHLVVGDVHNKMAIVAHYDAEEGQNTCIETPAK